MDKKNQYLLYCDKGVPAKKDKMTLRNIRTGQQQFFHFPTDITDEPEILHRIFHIPGFAKGCFTFPRGWFSQFTEHLSIIVYGEKIKGGFQKIPDTL